MKKIGILFGAEETFPKAFIDRVNFKKEKGIVAEAVTIDKVIQNKDGEYAVIIDRISQDVPFYRSYLKNAALTGTNVINNPFWWSADDKFLNNGIAHSVDVPTPNTVLLPSSEHPDNTTGKSFRNLKYPMDWQTIFDYIGFPAYLKPYSGSGCKNVYRIENKEDFYDIHKETGQLVMMLQEEIQFSHYFRVYCLGRKYVHVMHYEPRNKPQERYILNTPPIDKKLLATIEDYTIKLCTALGYDFNTLEFAVRDGIPHAIDFGNQVPQVDLSAVGPTNFEWVVEHAAKIAINAAKKHKPGKINLTWGNFIKDAIDS